MADPDDEFLRELVKYHVSGQLKVAPEHVSGRVLEKMGKPAHSVYEAFVKKYKAVNRDCGMEQYLVPYLMSSHPGCTMKEAVELASTCGTWAICRSRCRIFIPLLPPFRPACITRGWTENHGTGVCTQKSP